jgi:HEAT repeat protein
LSQRPESVVRLAALEALASLESATGVKALFAAMGDSDREIRTAATDAIERTRPPGAAEELQHRLHAGALQGYDDVEQMNFLKTCVAVCGDTIVADLSQILNGRRWWGGRRPPALRAGAARALGLLGTDEARRELQKSAGDKTASVNSAVRAAVRDLESGEVSVR